jgi:hypothetical protein
MKIQFSGVKMIAAADMWEYQNMRIVCQCETAMTISRSFSFAGLKFALLIITLFLKDLLLVQS